MTNTNTNPLAGGVEERIGLGGTAHDLGRFRIKGARTETTGPVYRQVTILLARPLGGVGEARTHARSIQGFVSGEQAHTPCALGGIRTGTSS